MMHSASPAYEYQYKRADFPKFVVDLSHESYCRCEMDRRNASLVDETLCEALYAFMTTLATTQTQSESVSTGSSAAVSMGFSFQQCKLTGASLELVERFLDRMFAHPDHQFAVNKLDFSGNELEAGGMAALASIVQKRKSVYNVEELNLDKIRALDFLQIVQTAFGMDSLPTLSSNTREQPLPIGAQTSQLRKITLDGDVLSSTACPAYFSAMPYGCPLEEDATLFVVPYVYYRQKYFLRWIPFGLFYPRPKRFVNAFKLRSIGQLDFYSQSVPTIVKTLRNPVAELLYNGDYDCEAPDTLMVCTVKKGANIRIVKTCIGTISPWTDTLQERSELEALCEREGGSFCVVVPGVGLGWVASEFVECAERESLESSQSEQRGWCNIEFSTPFNIDFDDLRSLLSLMGRQIWTLTLDFNEHGRSRMQLFMDHCVNLEHLVLQHVPPAEMEVFIEALRGDLGSRLLSLKLQDNPAPIELAEILANSENPPALRELRLAKLDANHLVHLHEALRVNRTLVLLELPWYFVGGIWGRKRLSEEQGRQLLQDRERLNSTFHGQLLRVSLPVELKLAFLSVVSNRALAGEPTALGRLDSWLLSLIFGFAACGNAVRRVITSTGKLRTFNRR